MGKWAAAVGLLALACLALAGCEKPVQGQDMFDQILAGDFGLGIAFEMSPEQVHAKLGKPAVTQERQGGKSAADYYLPPEVTATGRDEPQLELTYIDGKLVRLYNRYFPEDPARPLAPLFIAPCPGVKLGATRQEIYGALKSPRKVATTDEWCYNSRDGRSITILLQYTEIEATQAEFCSSITVVLGAQVKESRGEELETRDWRKLGEEVKEGAGK